MSKSKTKYSPVFFTSEDEVAFSDHLKTKVHDIKWVNGNRWPTPEPVLRDSPRDCDHNVIYLWSPSVCDKLPFIKGHHGWYQGPASGVVIQFCRCLLREGILQDGSMSSGYGANDTKMAEFVKIVWKVLRALASARLTSFDPTGTIALHENISNFIVGPDATRFASEEPKLAAGIIRFQAVANTNDRTSQPIA